MTTIPGTRSEKAAGFSTIELMIAMGLTMVMMGVAGQLIMTGMAVRNGEDQKTDAIADAQRVLNVVSREVANSGFGLQTSSGAQSNGLVVSDCSATSIRFRANLNAFNQTSNVSTDANDDLKFYLQTTATDSYVVRYDVNTSDITVLANRIDAFNVYYYDSKVSYTSNLDCTITSGTAQSTDISKSTYIVIVACVRLPTPGWGMVPGSPGYRPSNNIPVVSDIVLRNANLQTY